MARDAATLANAKVDLARYQTLCGAERDLPAAARHASRPRSIPTPAWWKPTAPRCTQATINLAYTRVIAPFDGVVTTRAVDVGNLVTVGTATSTTALFTVSDQNRMRIYVRLPQNYASYVRPDMAVTFTVPQYPNRIFNATLVANAGAVVAATGTVLIQFGTDNSDHALQPGAYANVRFPLPAGANGIRLPATALMFRDAGMQVATVDAANHVRLKTVNILRDMGANVDVGGGISPSDRIIDNPADALQEGDRRPDREPVAAPRIFAYKMACECGGTNAPFECPGPGSGFAGGFDRLRPEPASAATATPGVPGPAYDTSADANQRFLADYAIRPGVKKLPDGLMYRVLQVGADGPTGPEEQRCG